MAVVAPLPEEGIGWFKGVPEPVAGCWYLDLHSRPGLGGRTRVGQLVYEAKTYEGKPGDRAAADALAVEMASAARYVFDHGPFPLKFVTSVVAVPAYPPKRPHNLAEVLAVEVAGFLGVRSVAGDVVKTRVTPPAKEHRESSLSSSDAYRATTDFTGETVLVVDDIVLSGGTLGAIGRVLERAGAKAVVGYVATRAERGLST